MFNRNISNKVKLIDNNYNKPLKVFERILLLKKTNIFAVIDLVYLINCNFWCGQANKITYALRWCFLF